MEHEDTRGRREGKKLARIDWASLQSMAAAGRAPIGRRVAGCCVESVRLYVVMWSCMAGCEEWNKNISRPEGEPQPSRPKRSQQGHEALRGARGAPQERHFGPASAPIASESGSVYARQDGRVALKDYYRLTPDVNTMKSASCVAPEHSERWVRPPRPNPRPPRPPARAGPLTMSAANRVRLLRGAIFRATGLRLGRISVCAAFGSTRRGRGPRNGAARTPSASNAKATWERVH